MAPKTRRFMEGGLLAALYAGLVLVRFHPLLPDFQTHHLGAPQPDLLNEAWLHQAVLRGIPRGAVLWTDLLEFPYGVNLLSTYLSYAHVLFTAPLALLLPWPTWWNASFLVALVSSGLSAAWAVRRISGSTAAGVLAGVPFVLMPWVVNEAHLGHLSQLWMAPMFCAAGCLHQVFCVPEERHAWRSLALWTVLAALIYWIYGLLIALLGALVLACHAPRLSRPLAGRLLAAALVIVGLLGPLAHFEFSRELVLREAAAGGITASTREAAVKRAWARPSAWDRSGTARRGSPSSGPPGWGPGSPGDSWPWASPSSSWNGATGRASSPGSWPPSSLQPWAWVPTCKAAGRCWGTGRGTRCSCPSSISSRGSRP